MKERVFHTSKNARLSEHHTRCTKKKCTIITTKKAVSIVMEVQLNALIPLINFNNQNVYRDKASLKLGFIY